MLIVEAIGTDQYSEELIRRKTIILVFLLWIIECSFNSRRLQDLQKDFDWTS